MVPSYSFLALTPSLFVSLAVFLAKESWSFHLPRETRSFPRQRQRQPKPQPLLRAINQPESSKNSLSTDSDFSERRKFVSDVLLSGVAGGVSVGTLSSSSLLLLLAPAPGGSIAAAATAPDVIATGTIKITPIAHTFVTTGGSSMPKPIRENDATRFFTNARVVYLFEGGSSSSSSSSSGDTNSNMVQEVVDLTKKRKADRGPGVTPGEVETLVGAAQLKWKAAGNSAVSQLVNEVAGKAKAMPDGDVLLVGPIPSGGTAADGRILAETAAALDTFVGGRREKGIISVLFDGPKENFKLTESGFPASELLWYSLPSKK
eukprot:jgi/Psemu1/4551/gm1.4551_g